MVSDQEKIRVYDKLEGIVGLIRKLEKVQKRQTAKRDKKEKGAGDELITTLYIAMQLYCSLPNFFPKPKK